MFDASECCKYTRRGVFLQPALDCCYYWITYCWNYPLHVHWRQTQSCRLILFDHLPRPALLVRNHFSYDSPSLRENTSYKHACWCRRRLKKRRATTTQRRRNDDAATTKHTRNYNPAWSTICLRWKNVEQSLELHMLYRQVHVSPKETTKAELQNNR